MRHYLLVYLRVANCDDQAFGPMDECCDWPRMVIRKSPILDRRSRTVATILRTEISRPREEGHDSPLCQRYYLLEQALNGSTLHKMLFAWLESGMMSSVVPIGSPAKADLAAILK